MCYAHKYLHLPGVTVRNTLLFCGPRIDTSFTHGFSRMGIIACCLHGRMLFVVRSCFYLRTWVAATPSMSLGCPLKCSCINVCINASDNPSAANPSLATFGPRFDIAWDNYSHMYHHFFHCMYSVQCYNLQHSMSYLRK